jgi:hypothetical protein
VQVGSQDLSLDLSLVVDPDAEPVDLDRAFLAFAKRVVERRRLMQSLAATVEAPAADSADLDSEQ